MAKRPRNTDTSFLAYIFSPKKNPAPVGLRRTTLKRTPGRKAARLKSFNRMNATSQEILKRSGTRESYLRGETSLADAKRSLRPKAVELGVAKPVRTRGSQVKLPATFNPSLARMIRQHAQRVLVDAGRPVNVNTMDTQMEYLTPDPEMLEWNYGQIKYAGRSGSEYEVVAAGVVHNPYWYH